MSQDIEPVQVVTPNDALENYEIRITNRRTRAVHVFMADELEINHERGRQFNENDCMVGFTNRDRVTVKAWRGFKYWGDFKPIERPETVVAESCEVCDAGGFCLDHEMERINRR